MRAETIQHTSTAVLDKPNGVQMRQLVSLPVLDTEEQKLDRAILFQRGEVHRYEEKIEGGIRSLSMQLQEAVRELLHEYDHQRRRDKRCTREKLRLARVGIAQLDTIEEGFVSCKLDATTQFQSGVLRARKACKRDFLANHSKIIARYLYGTELKLYDLVDRLYADLNKEFFVYPERLGNMEQDN